jgi:hypothetical protein
MFTIENAKEYLKAVVTVLKGMNDPTGMNTKTCECIELLLDHCEALEMENGKLKVNQILKTDIPKRKTMVEEIIDREVKSNQTLENIYNEGEKHESNHPSKG